MKHSSKLNYLTHFGQVEGHFCVGRVFLFCSGGEGALLGGDSNAILSPGGSFFGEGDFVFFFDVGGSPLVGGK